MAPLLAASRERFALWRGGVPRFNLWDRSFSRVELDQRSREALLRLERHVKLLIPRTTGTHSLLRRLVRVLSARRYSAAPQCNDGITAACAQTSAEKASQP
jgi:hypothetical protein